MNRKEPPEGSAFWGFLIMYIRVLNPGCISML